LNEPILKQMFRHDVSIEFEGRCFKFHHDELGFIQIELASEFKLTEFKQSIKPLTDFKEETEWK